MDKSIFFMVNSQFIPNAKSKSNGKKIRNHKDHKEKHEKEVKKLGS